MEKKMLKKQDSKSENLNNQNDNKQSIISKIRWKGENIN